MNILESYPEDVFSTFEPPVLNKWKSIELEALEPMQLQRASSDFSFFPVNFCEFNVKAVQDYEIFPLLNFAELFSFEPEEIQVKVGKVDENLHLEELEEFLNGFDVVEVQKDKEEELFFQGFDLFENEEELDFFNGFNLDDERNPQRPARAPRPPRQARPQRQRNPPRPAPVRQQGRPQDEEVDYQVFGLFEDHVLIRLPHELIEDMKEFAFNCVLELDPHSISCKICLRKSDDYLQLDCSHRFCIECYKLFSMSLLDCGKIMQDDLNCPECSTRFSDALFLRYFSFEEVEKIKNLRFKLKGQILVAQKKAVSCPVPDCPGYAHILEHEKITACCKCRCTLCCSCGLAVHPGITCEENAKESQDETLEKLLLSQNWKKCPTCGVPVEKLDGCQFLYCSSMICKGRNNLCYICGRFVIEAQHFSHYKTKGPFGDTCNTIDGIPEEVDPSLLVPQLGEVDPNMMQGGEEE
jgi:hypothetical protein